jgi:hypothetical protein
LIERSILSLRPEKTIQRQKRGEQGSGQQRTGGQA